MSAGGMNAIIGGNEQGESTGNQSVNLYNNPERLNERISISMSLIDQDYLGTWGQAGLIIEAPTENIVITSEQDNGTANSNYTILVKARQQTPIVSGDELLKSSCYGYNEVVAVSSIDGGGELKLAGFFYKTNRRGEPLDYSTYAKMKIHSNRLKLPLVPIQEKVHDHPDGVSIESDDDSDEKRTVIYLNNVRYLVNGFSGTMQFHVVDGTERHFASPDEMKDMIERTLAAGHIDEEVAKKIITDYNEADHKRSLPRVEFNEDGSVKEIEKRIGYGNSEKDFWIGKAGYAWEYDATKRRQYTIAQMNSGDGSFPSVQDLSWQQPLTKQQAESVVSEAIENLPKEQADIVRVWWQNTASHFEVKNTKKSGYFDGASWE
jgi:hypothetical protein